jgi:hypothetical protein
LCAGAASGQIDVIGLYADADVYVACAFLETSTVLDTVFVVHKPSLGATSSRWMVESNGGFGCSYVAETVRMPSWTGNSQTGILLQYGGCLTSDNVLLVMMYYFCQGTSSTCSYLEVVADPASGSRQIEAVDCTFKTRRVDGRKLYANPGPGCDPCWNPTENTSWGKIKTLYQ